jgi:uncharacterized protein
MQTMKNVESLLQKMIRMMVDSPNEVSVMTILSHDSTMFRVSVAPNEAGQVIGKQGRTAKSMRTLLSGMGIKAKTRYALEIIDDSSVNDPIIDESKENQSPSIETN